MEYSRAEFWVEDGVKELDISVISRGTLCEDVRRRSGAKTIWASLAIVLNANMMIEGKSINKADSRLDDGCQHEDTARAQGPSRGKRYGCHVP